MLGAFQGPPARIARETAPVVNEDLRATILGSARTTTMDAAACANGVLIRFLDYNDTYLSKEPAHPSDNIAACLAAAEAAGRGGKEFLTAIVAAYEIQCGLATQQVCGRGLTMPPGAFSSAAVPCLWGFKESNNAVNIAGTISPALGGRGRRASMRKGCACQHLKRTQPALSSPKVMTARRLYSKASSAENSQS
jgi:2-methylcitrate dehydratase